MANLRLLHGPLLLLLYQAAPLHVEHDSLGSVRVSVGYAAGQWQRETFGCDGGFIDATPVQFQSAGAQLDAWPSRNVRATVFAGGTRERGGDAPVAAIGTLPWVMFEGFQLAYEGQHFGAGLGLADLGAYEAGRGPSVYLRVGDIDHAHLRLETLPPSATFPVAGWARVGAGFNEGQRRGIGGFFGLGFGPVDYSAKVLFTGELRVPVGRHLTSQVHALFGPGEVQAQYGGGVSLRVDF